MARSLASEKNQNFWQLGCILGSALGLPAMIVGSNLATLYGAGTAIVSICIGNIVLWIFGLSIIFMAEGKNNAIENVKAYLGKTTGLIAAVVLVLAFLSWYAIQIKGVATILGNQFHSNNHWEIGVVLGFLAAIFGMGGIGFIRRFCVVLFPVMLIFASYLVFTTTSQTPFDSAWKFSFSAILSVILIWLPGIINLPTFFRHSRSKADSILALSLIALFHILLQIFPIFLGNRNVESYFVSADMAGLPFYVLAAFVFIAYFCINLVNIYFASAGWELIFPSNKNMSKYLIIGSLGTLFYVFIENYITLHRFNFPIIFLETMAASFIISLGVVLLLNYLAKVTLKRKPHPQDQFWSSFCWLVGCISAVVFHRSSGESNFSFIIAASASIIAFLCISFIKETIWSLNQFRKDF